MCRMGYFDVVSLCFTTTVSLQLNLLENVHCLQTVCVVDAHDFAENIQGNCVSVFVRILLLTENTTWMQAIISAVSSTRAVRKTWLPRATHLFCSHLQSEQQHAAHNKTHTNTSTHSWAHRLLDFCRWLCTTSRLNSFLCLLCIHNIKGSFR